LLPFSSELSSCLFSKNIKIKIYKTIILHVVLYGCGARSLTLKEEKGLMVCEKMMLRGIFGPKRVEVVGGWRRLHNELHNLYASSNIIRVIKSSRLRWMGNVAHVEEIRNA
jgi:hypothetical protein